MHSTDRNTTRRAHHHALVADCLTSLNEHLGASDFRLTVHEPEDCEPLSVRIDIDMPDTLAPRAPSALVGKLRALLGIAESWERARAARRQGVARG